ncbi:MAG: hypothetical protein FJ026_11760 [Chloroflexi bacterium]|nr:hypothetical protein [Chloroflexota bacterium]
MLLRSPVVILSLVIATLYAAVFHLLWGKTLRELLLYWVTALLGFAAGQMLASRLSWRDINIGEIHLLAASAASWLGMVFARRLKV